MAQDLAYNPSPRGVDTHFDPALRGRRLFQDPAMQGSDHELAKKLPDLFASPDWEDRVRAQFILAALTNQSTLPDNFPVLMESHGSPSIKDRPSSWSPQRSVWVAHSDITVLEALLEDYQAMWDQYTAQWGASARRVFVVTRLDDVNVSKLRRPECTADDILISTAVTHSFERFLREDLKPENRGRFRSRNG